MPNVDDLRNQILEEGHSSHYLIHSGHTKMYHDLREVFWLDGLKNDIAEFVTKCPNCKQVKAEHQKSCGLLQEMQVPSWKWEDINLDLIVGLPWTRRKNDSIWVVLDSFTKFAPFIPVKSTYYVEECASIYINEVMSLHGISLSVIFYRGSQFTSRF